MHKSFRQCVNKADNVQLFNAEAWPTDVTISRWFFKKPADDAAAAAAGGSVTVNCVGPSSDSSTSAVAAAGGGSDTVEMDSTSVYSYNVDV